jgi:hypothetical protein
MDGLMILTAIILTGLCAKPNRGKSYTYFASSNANCAVATLPNNIEGENSVG